VGHYRITGNVIAEPIVGKVMPKSLGETDEFNALILLNTYLTVTIISICLSIIGPLGWYEKNKHKAFSKLLSKLL